MPSNLLFNVQPRGLSQQVESSVTTYLRYFLRQIQFKLCFDSAMEKFCQLPRLADSYVQFARLESAPPLLGT